MLPKIKHPLFSAKLPLSGQEITFRQLLTSDEKILLIAKESQDKSDILGAIRQVVNNCITTENFDIDDMAVVDLEYMFIKLREVSIGNIVNVSYRDGEDNKAYNFDVDLAKVTVKFPKTDHRTITVDDSITINLKYPAASLYHDKEFLRTSGSDVISKLTSSCIKSIQQNGVSVPIPEDENELEQWLDQLPAKTFDQFKKFFADLPSLTYTIEYKNSLDNDRKIELTGLYDFFTLG